MNKTLRTIVAASALSLLPGLAAANSEVMSLTADPNNWARLICSEPNLFDMLGVDRGSGFEVLEDSPDYKP